MNATLKHILRSWVLPFFDPRPLAGLARLPRFFGEWRRYRAASSEAGLNASNLWPCLADRTAQTPFDPHYFFQGAWLARRLAATKPALHVDVGSSVVMLSVMSATVPTVFLDYRPIAPNLAGLVPVAGNLTRLPFADDSIQSLSCLHVIEHVGLGRYGDPLDPTGGKRALGELARVLAPGGRLYVSMPVGLERVCFNAHRVFAPQAVLAAATGLTLESFSLVDDAGAFQAEVALDRAQSMAYGCGMFVMRKQESMNA
ncbi:MAG: DUF268 domain-containing protein [Burkholderiales bacterium]